VIRVSLPCTLELPPAASARRFSVRGVELAVLDTIPEARGGTRRSTVVLVPGFTGSKEDFLAILQPIADAGHRVVAIDQRGQYESTGGGDDPSRHTLDELAADLAALVEALGDGPVHLVGHSLGGLVCRAAVLAGPALARSLVLLDSGPAAICGTWQEHAKLFRAALAEYGLGPVWAAMQALDEANGIPPVQDPRIAEFMRRRFHANLRGSLLAMTDILAHEADRTAELAQTGVPILVAHGENENRWPPDVQAEMAARLGAPRAVIEGAAHSPAVEQPKRTAGVLTLFWGEVESAAP
jgi:pimeloyl-ACP methyl ester carboxylesterase